MKKIVILGGSFNPPTIAHGKLMETSMKAINADLGIFVPSSDKYVERKMLRAKHNNQTYDEYTRAHMLNIMCDSLENCTVDTLEYGDDGRGHTYRTLCKIQEKHPDAELYFVCGADKLNIIPKWHSSEDLLTNFYFIVTAREGDDPYKQIENNIKLKKFRNKFIVVEQPDVIDSISSTEARKLINKKSNKIYNVCNKLVADYILHVK